MGDTDKGKGRVEDCRDRVNLRNIDRAGVLAPQKGTCDNCADILDQYQDWFYNNQLEPSQGSSHSHLSTSSVFLLKKKHFKIKYLWKFSYIV